MRWKIVKDEPKAGETRIRLVFAWKKKEVKGHIVWLERYEVHERFFVPRDGMNGWWSHVSTELFNPVYY